MSKELTSIVKRKEYDITVDWKGEQVSRRVIVFENKTDNEADVYVELKGQYIYYYLHSNIKGDMQIDLPKLVYESIIYESDTTIINPWSRLKFHRSIV